MNWIETDVDSPEFARKLADHLITDEKFLRDLARVKTGNEED